MLVAGTDASEIFHPIWTSCLQVIVLRYFPLNITPEFKLSKGVAPFYFSFSLCMNTLPSHWIPCLIYISQSYRVINSYQFFILVTTSLDCMNEPLPPFTQLLSNQTESITFLIRLWSSWVSTILLSLNSEYVITICHFTVVCVM